MARTQKITATHLWFNGNAEAAVEFLRLRVSGLEGHEHRAVGGGRTGAAGVGVEHRVRDGRPVVPRSERRPQYPFTPAISLFVTCESQVEVDELWTKFLDGGGKPNACGWLDDRYGLSWQTVGPRRISRHTSMTLLSRAMALAMVNGPAAGLAALDDLALDSPHRSVPGGGPRPAGSRLRILRGDSTWRLTGRSSGWLKPIRSLQSGALRIDVVLIGARSSRRACRQRRPVASAAGPVSATGRRRYCKLFQAFSNSLAMY